MIFLFLQIVTSVEYLPIYGTTEFPGFYYSKISIGSQKKVKKMMIDLGSDLLALTCVGCSGCGKDKDNYYNYTESSTSVILHKNSKDSTTVDYSVEYVEGSELKGFLIKESLSFKSLTKEINLTAVFGCNSHETGVFTENFVDGIMGLPIKKHSSNSLVKFLMKTNAINHNIFSVCIGAFDGFLSFGGIDESLNNGSISWIRLTEENYFIIESENLLIGDEFSRKTIMIQERFMIASGSTITYFRDSLFREFLKLFKDFCDVKGNCQAKPLEIKDFEGLCFENNQIGETFDFKSFPVLEMVIERHRILFRPESYLVRVKHGRPGSFCLGVLLNSYAELNILGTNFLRSKHFYFDFEQMRAGIADSVCDLKLNNSEIEYFVYEFEDVTEVEIMMNSFYVFSIFLIMNFVICFIFRLLKKIRNRINEKKHIGFSKSLNV